MQAYALEGGCYQQYLQAVEALSAQPPRVAGETESLYEMLKNVSYFYRVIGKKRVLVAADILKNERDVMEPAMRVFYLWYTGPSDQLKGRPSLSTTYAIRELPARHVRRPQLPAAPRFPDPAAGHLLLHPCSSTGPTTSR